MAKKRGPKPKVDWDNIEIEIVPVDEPNPGNPYSEWTQEEREKRINGILGDIYLRTQSEQEETGSTKENKD